MNLKDWVETQKSQWRPQASEKTDSGNPGMDVYLKSAERKGGAEQ